MLKFALKNMAVKKVQIVLIVLSIVISAGVSVLAYNVATQVEEGITNNAGYYSAIIGPAGSSTQLAMNSMYFSESPVGTIPYSVVSSLQQDNRVNSVIPFAMADNYNGYGVVGTTPDFLKDKGISEGEMFGSEDTMQAVVGYNIARYNSLKVGDTIYTSHSASDTDTHTQGIRIVGILEQSHSSYDNIVFTQLKTLWEMHDHGDHDEHDGEEAADHDGHAGEESSEHDETVDEEIDEHNDHEDKEQEEEPAHSEPSHTGSSGVDEKKEEQGEEEHHVSYTVCAVLVNTKNPGYAMQLVNDYNGKIITDSDGESCTLQAIEPMSVIRDVLNDTDDTKYIVFVLCAVILIMNIMIISIITLLNMYHSAKEISLMRLIGISMKRINLLYIIQNSIMGICSVSLAFGMSRLCMRLMNGYVESMGVVLDMSKVYVAEFIILFAIFVISVLPTVIWTFIMSRKDSISD